MLCIGNSLNQHATFDYRDDLFEGKQLIHVNISAGRDRQGLQGRPRDRRRRRAGGRRADSRRSTGQVGDGRRGRGRRAATTRHARILHLIGEDPSRPAGAGASAACCRPAASCSPTPAPTSPGSATTSSSRRARTSARPGTFGPMAGHVNGALGREDGPPRPHRRRRLRRRLLLLSRLRADDRRQHDIPVIWVIFNDNEFKLIKLYQLSALLRDRRWSSSRTPTSRPTPGPAAPTATASRRSRSSRTRSPRRCASGRPTVIDAKITRWALPHYSPSPEGVVAGVVEMVEERLPRRMSLTVRSAPGRASRERLASARAEHMERRGRGIRRRQRRGRARRVRAAGAGDHAACSSTDARTAGAHGVPHGVDRAFHAKATLAVDDAELRFLRPARRSAGRASRSPARPTRRSCASPTPPAAAQPDTRPTCAASRCGSQRLRRASRTTC